MSQGLVVETKNLTKRYDSKNLAVNNLTLGVKRGEVYGFLGANGAGKTTTMRMLLGLIEPTSGTIEVLSKKPGNPATLLRVGALVESPAFYPYLSGRDNLKAVARYSGIVPKDRIGEVLKQVGLYERAKDKFKKYSTGMKQRLGVAAALLKDPDLLILDEPTNGLDPKAMAEMREFIRNLGGEKTVLLSSHMLGEVEQVCDRIGIIHRGSLAAEGTISELVGEKRLVVQADPLEQATRVARRLDGVEGARIANGILELDTNRELAAQINRKLVSAGIDVSELRWEQQSLEEVFLGLTREGVVQDGD